MELENKSGLITHSMKGNGNIIYPMVMEERSIQMEMSMKDFGKTERDKAKEPSNKKMAAFILENGLMTTGTDKEQNS